MRRRGFIESAAMLACGGHWLVSDEQITFGAPESSSASEKTGIGTWPLCRWERSAENPIFVPESMFDRRGAQAPYVVEHDGLWWMFYAGIGDDGVQRICLATARPEKPREWNRIGPILPNGAAGSFDEQSATYPRIHRFSDRWHLYYSGRSRRRGAQHFSEYYGIGLAQSFDLQHWEKYSDEPVLDGTGIVEYPDNQSLVGLGNILDPDMMSVDTAQRSDKFRMYYTLLPGKEDPDWKKNGTWHVIEHKLIASAESVDGIHWTDRRVVMERRRDVASEDIAVVGMNVWKTPSHFHAVYTGLGSRTGSYVLAEAVSQDGLNWDRGAGSNISMTSPSADDSDAKPVQPQDVPSKTMPHPSFWEREMIGYPSILHEGKLLRMFYNGSSGGSTGIGMATTELSVTE